MATVITTLLHITASGDFQAMKQRLHDAFKLIGVIFEDYKFARRFMFFWAICIATDAYLWAKGLDSISDNQRLVMLAIFTFMSLMIGFYQWSRGRD